MQWHQPMLGVTDNAVSGMQSNGTGPASRQLQDKVGGVTPAGLFLDQADSELLDIVSCGPAGLAVVELVEVAHRLHDRLEIRSRVQRVE